MKIYKIAQNTQYLQNLGVPSESIDEILEFILSMEGKERKKAVRQIRKNPNISLNELKGPMGKEKHLKEQNIPQEVIDFSKKINPKYSVWISREIMKWIKSIEKWNKKVEWLKQKKNASNIDQQNEIQSEINKMYMQKEPTSGVEYQHLYKNIKNGDKDLFKYMMTTEQQWKEIMDWIKQTDPDIMQYNLEEAIKATEQWHENLRQQEKDEALQYKTDDVVHSFEDGWRIVKLSPGDCKAEGNRMGHCVGGYSDDIAQGRTQIYSLRDPKNEPHATIEMTIPQKTNDDDYGIDHETIEVEQIQGKEDKEPIEEYKNYIKQWFQSLKSQGYVFEAIEPEQTDSINVSNFTEFLEEENDYGLPVRFYEIGGDAETWFENLKEAYMQSENRGYFNERMSTEIIDNLIDYAIKHREIKDFERGLELFGEWAFENLQDYLIQYDSYDEKLSYPSEEDFTTYPEDQSIKNQIEFNNEDFENTKKEVFDAERYNKALEKFYEQEAELESEHPPSRTSSYAYKKWEEAKTQAEREKSQNQKEKNQKVAKRKNMIKIASEEIPSAEEIANYIEALNIHLKHGKVKDEQIKTLIKNLPYPDTVRFAFSEQECKIIFESIAYAWGKITNQNLKKQIKIKKAPEGLNGNYWMIKNGILLKGPNHFTIAKQNLDLFASLLNISTFVLHEKIASPPLEIIKTIIDHGGMRMFVNNDNELYCQVNDETYSEWARAKVKKMDCKKRVVNVIDTSRPYKGWDSGVAVIL